MTQSITKEVRDIHGKKYLIYYMNILYKKKIIKVFNNIQIGIHGRLVRGAGHKTYRSRVQIPPCFFLRLIFFIFFFFFFFLSGKYILPWMSRTSLIYLLIIISHQPSITIK